MVETFGVADPACKPQYHLWVVNVFALRHVRHEQVTAHQPAMKRVS